MENKRNTIKVDHVGKKLWFTPTFMKGARVDDSPECKKLLELQAKYINYDVAVKPTQSTGKRNNHKHLTFKYMVDYLSEREGADSINVANLKRLIQTNRIQCSRYNYVKKWFLKYYADYANPDALLRGKKNIVAHGIEDIIRESEQKAAA